MAGEWEDKPLFEVAEVIFGYPFDSAFFNANGIGAPVVRIRDLKHPSGCLYTTQQDFPESVRIARGDLLVGMDAEFRPYRWSGPEALLNQRVCKIVPRSGDVLDREFLRAALWIPLESLELEKTGTTVSHLNKADLERVRIPWPEAAQRRAIAHILGTLDDKLELNRRMSETLEGMARAIFKAWFVDFEPVRAKMEGRWRRGESLPGLPAHLYDLFPDRLVDSELGEIPEGWPARPLKEVLTEKNDRVGEADIPEYSSTNDGLQLRSKRFRKRLSASTHKNKLIRQGDLVFGLSRQVLNFGLMRDTVGCVSPAYRVFAVDEKAIAPDLLERMMRIRSSYFYNAISGSSREGQSISPQGLGQLRFVQPSTAVQYAFYCFTEPLRIRVNVLQSESRTLAALRDALLPKLIRGEIRVKDAERFLEERGR